MSVDTAALRLVYDAERVKGDGLGKLGDILAANEMSLLIELLDQASVAELREAVIRLALDYVKLVDASAVDFEAWIVERGAHVAGLQR
jgi:hypothetical protein